MVKKLKQVIQRILLLLCSLLVSILISELFLKVINYNYTPMRIKILNNSDWRYFHIFEDKSFIYDPYLIWRPKNNFSVFNSQGYRGKELSTENKIHEFRIFAFGDSNVLGWNEENGPNWPRYLQELLGGRFAVINAGVWGYTSFQGLRRFKESLPFCPDMVLISFGSNDAHPVTTSDAEYTSRTIRKIKLDKVFIKFRTGQLLLSVLDKSLLKNKEDLTHRVDLEEYKSNLNEIIKLSKQRDIKIVLLTRPYIGESFDKNMWKSFAPAYNKATIEVAKNNAIPVIDIYSYFKGKEEFFADECHFNEKGHREAAKIIYENIKAIVY